MTDDAFESTRGPVRNPAPGPVPGSHGPAHRREFLRRARALTLAGAAMPWAMQLSALGEAAAATASDYKALVCVFLYGGNDYANTVVPYDPASHALYQSLRPNLAYDLTSLAATALAPASALPDGRQFALAPELAPLLPIFDSQDLAVLLNVGALVQPTTKAQYTSRSVPLPPKLFSHNDQQSYWQASLAEGANSGWGGRLADLFVAGNANATFTCINVSGNAVFLTGRTAVQYQMSTNGPVAMTGVKNTLFGSSACSQLLKSLVSAPRSHLIEHELTRVSARALDANDQVTAALAGGPTLATAFAPGNSLAAQLRMVARMIGSSAALGARRQVFFVSLGGFDTHSALTATHPGLLATVASALSSFHQATLELGVANQVTTFTASDFGRTLLSNNDGSDHGWGSMHFVMGGAVRGNSFYGSAPQIASDGPDDVGQGRLLPTTAVEQMGATLARWFGVSASDVLTVMPNLVNFDPGVRDLGFMSG